MLVCKLSKRRLIGFLSVTAFLYAVLGMLLFLKASLPPDGAAAPPGFVQVSDAASAKPFFRKKD